MKKIDLTKAGEAAFTLEERKKVEEMEALEAKRDPVTGQIPWSEEELAVIKGIEQLILGRVKCGFVGLTPTIQVPADEDDDEETNEQGFKYVYSFEDFCEAIVEELDEIERCGKTFLSFSLAQVYGDMRGMMGLKAEI